MHQPSSEIEDIDVRQKNVRTVFDAYRVDVLNVIPPQTAGRLALDAGLASRARGWCDVDFTIYASTQAPDIHVLGDAVDSGLPKSAHIAASQASVCAGAIIAILAGQPPDPDPVLASICYSYVNDRMAMHIANAYRFDPVDRVMKPVPGGGLPAPPSEKEGRDARSWAQNIWRDVLA